MTKRGAHRITSIISSSYKIKKDPTSKSILGGKMVGNSQVLKNRRTISTRSNNFIKGTEKIHIHKKSTTVKGRKHVPGMKKRSGMTKRAYRILTTKR